MQFGWDEEKAASNLRKHGVSFQEARTVFNNPLAVIFDDRIHSATELREIIVGHSLQNRLLFVCFTQQGPVVRIISARAATRKEREDYEKNILFGRGYPG